MKKARFEEAIGMGSKIAVDKPGSFLLLNGDEAIARGAVEAGVKVAASYPGTPATEILETLAEGAKDFGIYTEWSINEIVAMEVASGASLAGIRAIVSMKHVGLNVAADAALTLAYTGVDGGMVIAVCDDPSMHSSQNEQDTRYFALHSNLPLLDAANPQEALDMTREAFEISEKLQLPVIVRLTTRVAHGKARVMIREIAKSVRKAEFDKNSSRWVMVPSNALRQHRVLKEKLKTATKLANSSNFNLIEDNGKEIGIIGSGIGYYYARSILDMSRFSWLKLGFIYPFPIELVKKFASKVKKMIVVEELRPFVENNIQCLHTEILGKEKLGLNEIGEFTPDAMREAFAELGLCDKTEAQETINLPPRPPVLCPGCPHRAFYYALNMASKKDRIVTGDIGCYTLGFLPPLNTVETCLCMGAGISQAAGLVHAGVKDKVFAIIGDSTFFHAGMPGLLNIAYNKSNVCVVILDNNVAAMTGHQPTPSSGRNVSGEETRVIRPQDIARSLGIEKVKVVDPYDIKETTKVIREIWDYQGPSVIVAERPCPLLIERGPKREILKECNSCGVCGEAFGCPAISMTFEGAEIDTTLCSGCGVCEKICPSKAIRGTG